MSHYTSLVKSAAAIDDAKDIMNSVYSENPKHWPNGLTAEHFDGGLYLVRKSASHEPVGFVGWQERNESDGKVGYYSVGIKPEYRRHGFAKEAVAKLVGEKSAGVDIVRALVDSTNKPSMNLASKLSGLGIETTVTKSASDDEAVIIDKGVSEGAPVHSVSKDKDGVTVYYSKDRGKPEDAKVVSRAEAEKMKKASGVEKSANLKAKLMGLLSGSKANQALGGASGMGLAEAENRYILEDASPTVKKINLLLGLMTGGKISQGLRAQKNLPANSLKRETLLGLANKSGLTAKQLGVAATSGVLNVGNSIQDFTNSAKDRVKTELEAAVASRDAAKSNLTAAEVALEGNPWKDFKDYAKTNDWVAPAAGITGASVLGAYLYNAMKKPNKPKPGVMTVEIPKGEVRDRFYTNLSRNMLFNEKKQPKKDKETLALEDKA